MGALKTQTARKNYKCSKCGAKIKKGDIYHKISHKFQQPVIRCGKCRPRQSELTTSDKLSRVYGVQESLSDWLDSEKPDIDELIDIIESGINELEEVASEYEEGADNIEEYFSSTSQSEEMREKSESINEWKDALDTLKDTAEEMKKNIEEKVQVDEGEDPWIEQLRTEVDSVMGELGI